MNPKSIQADLNQAMMFDIEASSKAIDNYLSCCISNDTSDFISQLIPKIISIK